MRLNINLASQPYEDSRRFLLGWGLGLLGLAILTVGLWVAAYRSWQNDNELRKHISTEQAKLAKLEEQQRQDMAILSRAENRTVREKSQFLNTLIRRKQFSWTRVFSSLEQIMPGRLHVVSITPQLNDDDQIVVRLRVAGDTRDKAIELVRNLEQSRSFRAAQILSEVFLDARSAVPGNNVQFEITALYNPSANSAAAAPSGAVPTGASAGTSAEAGGKPGRGGE